jgi:hypothetical protein
MTTMDQISETTRTNQRLEDAIQYRPGGRVIVPNGQLSWARDRAFGDYATGQRTYPDSRVVRGDFATGMRTIAKRAAVGDFATGMRTMAKPAAIGDFATGMRTEVEVRFHEHRVSVPAIAA